VGNLEARRIAKTNDERAALAARRGWGFTVEGPELADRWRYALPFSLRGEQELVFGVVSGRHTPNPEFNRWYRLVNTDPQVAAQVLHPSITQYVRKNKLHTWALTHNELVFTTFPIFTRTKPDALVETLDRLAGLTTLLPLEQYR
jgi:hypothetical protein